MKLFLSHSSADKKSYADIVAEKFGGRIEYDAQTFEEGMGNLEEILKALGRSDIFVLLLSSKSLESEWVKKEITEAKARIDSGDLIRFFPLVIDRSITHDDPRIPSWISDSYNLRPVTRPVVAAKRIRERLVEASWDTHPSLKDRHEIFVGRNSLIAEFEQRMDNFSLDAPTAVIASGLQGIGRRATMKYSLRKSNVIRNAYDPLKIELSRDDSIEGLILKLFDTGVFEGNTPDHLMSMQMQDKINLAASYLKQLPELKEILLIEDQRCIVRYDQSIAPWFLEILDIIPKNQILLCVASAAKAHQYNFKKDERLFFMHVSEMELAERNGLFKRYLDLLGVEISRDELQKFAGILTGLPEQVTFAATMVESLGPQGALLQSNEIVSFSKLRAGIYLRKYDSDLSAISALRFLSSFEFFSLDFVLDIETLSGEKLVSYLNEFISNFVCEPVGSSGSYYRINEIIRDSIIRDNLSLNKNLSEALARYVRQFANDYSNEHYDVSEYYIAANEALITGDSLPERLLIPAHFLKTMKDLYTAGKYDEVIKLADRVLSKESNYDKHTTQDIRYYLCQSLAKNRDARFTAEVQKIEGPEHDFLFGFYYRLRGKFEEALQRYNKAKKHNRTQQRAAREIVFVLTTTEDYEAAISLAKENFERFPQNPFMVQAYLQCVMHSAKAIEDKTLAQDLLDALKAIGGKRAEEMYANLSARHEFQFGDIEHSFEMIDSAIKMHPDTEHPILTKLDMAIHYGKVELISRSLKQLREATRPKSHTLAKKKAEIILHALSGDVPRALRMVDQDLNEMSLNGRERLRRKLLAL